MAPKKSPNPKRTAKWERTSAKGRADHISRSSKAQKKRKAVKQRVETNAYRRKNKVSPLKDVAHTRSGLKVRSRLQRGKRNPTR